MDVAEHFDRSVNFQYHWLVLQNSLALLSERDDMLSAECEVTIAVILGRPLFRSE